MKPLLRTFSNFNQLKLAILTSIENKYAEKLKLRKVSRSFSCILTSYSTLKTSVFISFQYSGSRKVKFFRITKI